MNNNNPADTRYPYTYACDLIRSKGGYNENGIALSRSDASQIRQLFATVLGIDDTELARKLADYYKANEDKITGESLKGFILSQQYYKKVADENDNGK
jgi:hypothetical protein